MDEATAPTLMDFIAYQLVARAAPLRFGLAQTPAERNALYRIRYHTVIAEGWAKPEEFPEGLECDAYDDAAIHVALWNEGTPVASARIVLPREGTSLPTEEAFDLVVEPRGEVADWGRFIVAPGYREREHHIFWQILAQAWLETRARGYSRICGILDSRMIELYHRMGLEFRAFAPARTFWNEQRYPCQLDVTVSAPRLAEHLNLAIEFP